MICIRYFLIFLFFCTLITSLPAYSNLIVPLAKNPIMKEALSTVGKKIDPEGEMLKTGLIIGGSAAAGLFTGELIAEIHNRIRGTHDPKKDSTKFTPDNISLLATHAVTLL